ncbi:hypothetical protein GQ55_5G206400 [Panicum hallii var. hallii]|uniref:RING-type E3 ubiquitin transferase n=1 Tax=Panicum hallii var. hallii TaxID=1504633 RepID=A0A2T7DIG0_9POAL|nr:hypothetical protein GQ55_5G206400 [Panicum hallii var. hallii]
MAPPAKNHNHLATYHLCFLLVLSVAALSSVVSATDSSLCTIPSPAPEHVAAGNDKLPLIYSFRLSAGYFSGGEDIHFARDESGGDDDGSFLHARRSFTLLPLRVDRTTDATVVHVSATLRLSGGRALHAVAAHRRRDRFAGGAHSVSFHLDGYYSSTSAELCMIGSGTYAEGDDWLEHLPGVVLRLRVPSPPSLSDPFVTGQLKGAGFDAITLVAYAEGDLYKYGQHASCPPPPSTARGALQALGASFSCAHLKEQLVSSYKLQYGGGGGAHASSTSPAPLRLQEPRMHVGQVQCTPDGAVRVYATFSSSTNMFFAGQLPPGFMVKEAAVVAEGRWDSALSTLCLRACRVVRSGPAALAVQEQDCGIGMSFWFPSVWTVRDRSIVAGTLWNASHETDGSSAAAAAGAISASSIDFDASSIDFDSNRGNFSDVEYRYTMVDEAKQRYFADVLRSHRNKTKGSFPAATYSYRDFEFRFYMDKGNGGSGYGHGEAHPVTIGSAMVYGDRLAAADSFSRHAEVDMELELLTVSYNIHIRRVPPNLNPMRLNLTSPVAIEERVVTAEGVYDPRTGVLCMIGCQELAGGSMDCRTLITVQFASLDAKAQGHGRGVISSLRPKADPLFFDKMDVVLFGMYAEQVAESVSRMDMESVMLVVSMTLPCLFTALQILRAKRSPEASAATSITMLVLLALGYAAPLVIGSEALFVSRGTEYAPFLRRVPHELRQAMLRAPTLIAFVLQLRLLQLAWSARRSAAGRSKAETAAERRALLWVCLPMYLLGGALTVAHHASISRRAALEDSLAVRVGPEPATLWEDLASSTGLALDGFLLPQVAMNAFLSGGACAVSPWFYVGGTVVRAMPHVYDAIRARGYVPSVTPSNVYASPRDDRFGAAWDVAVPWGAALLAVLLFLQQRLGAFSFGSRRRSGEYEMVSTQQQH